MNHDSPRRLGLRRIAEVWAIAAVLAHAAVTRAGAQTAASVLVYEYVYPYNTPDLIENHYIVLDTAGAVPRGWYWGTSDEFDVGREGYLPGFFVAPMSDLVLAATTISFTLDRPRRLFVSPLPLEYRSAGDVPAGLIEEWSVPLSGPSRPYVGELRGGEITLDVPGGPRVFRRKPEP